MKTTGQIVIVGASARAAASSAIRGGLRPVTADRFADSDLCIQCPAIRVDDYPDGLVQIFDGLPSSPWMYTGALENRPDLVQRLSRKRPLLGNSAATLRRLRNPVHLADAFRHTNIPFPDLSVSLPNDSSAIWVDKPIRSSGGSMVTILDKRDPSAPIACEKNPRYYQRFIPGQPCSAVYLAANGIAVPLGMTYQLVGQAWCGASGFMYCGSVGPVAWDASIRGQWERIGQCLAGQFPLRGVFGVDAILNDGVVWPIEVNPRYPASAELYDWAWNTSVVGWHADACNASLLPSVPFRPDNVCHGKAIVYAAGPFVMTDRVLKEIMAWNQGRPWPVVADIPAEGTRMESGHPVLTVFAAGQTVARVQHQLRQLASEVIGRLEG